jgi:Uma2 family endonuclease
MSAASKPARQTTADEFLDRDSGDGRMRQLVDGRPEAMAPASFPHAILQAKANVQRFTTIPSVLEVLVLHSQGRAADLRRLPDGSWPGEPARIAGGELRLDSVGFAAPVAELHARMPAG